MHIHISMYLLYFMLLMHSSAPFYFHIFLVNLQYVLENTLILFWKLQCCIAQMYINFFLDINPLIDIYFILDLLQLQITLWQVTLHMCRNVCVCHTHVIMHAYYRQYELNSINKGEINQKSHAWEPLAWVIKGDKSKNIKIYLLLSKVYLFYPHYPKSDFPMSQIQTVINSKNVQKHWP